MGQMQAPMMGDENMPQNDLDMNQDGLGDEMMDNQPDMEQQNNGESEFDTNFDAGVEADEDTDPKKYIQQLTGKLSTTLNNFNNENEDEGLNKYVAKMIVKQATKNLDDAAKKDIIKAINTSSEKDVDEDEPDTEMKVDDESNDVVDSGETNDMIQEMVFTKSKILQLKEEIKSELLNK